MKNFTRKILVSIIAVAFAFVAMGTSTYAWFTMNKEVTASGMQITAKVDNMYLIIGSGEVDTVEELEASSREAADKKATTITVDAAAAAVYPAAHDTVDSYTAAATVGNWYTEQAKQASASLGDDTTKTALTAENFAQYVVKQTVYLTLATGSVDSGKLTIDLMSDSAIVNAKTTTNQTAEAIKVLVAITYGTGETPTTKVIEGSLSADAKSITWAANNELLASMKAATLAKVDIYLYIDGNNEKVYVQNADLLAGAKLNFMFKVASADNNA